MSGTPRRDLYQTLLYEAHTASTASQHGILSFLKTPGSYTLPVPQSPIPSTRLLLRAHLNAETVKILVYRPSILSVTGEIPCINGTRQVCTLYDSNLLYT